MIRLTNPAGQTLDISPGNLELFAFLSMKLRPEGVTVEHFDPARPYGLTSGRRFPADDRPPMSPEGERLFGQFSRLEADAAELSRALDGDLDRTIKRVPRG